MKIKAIFWTNDHDIDINDYIKDEIDDLVTIQQANSQADLLGKLAKDKAINIILTIINVNDIASLYQIQQIQKQHQEMPIIAIFDSGSKLVLGDSAERLMTMLHHHPIVNNESPARVTTSGQLSERRGLKEQASKVKLTKRQVDVLKLLIHGKSNKQIARDLDLSEGTVKIHCMAIFKEIGVANRTQAALRAEVLMHNGALALNH